MLAIHSRFSPINISLLDIRLIGQEIDLSHKNIHRIAPLNPGWVLA